MLLSPTPPHPTLRSMRVFMCGWLLHVDNASKASCAGHPLCPRQSPRIVPCMLLPRHTDARRMALPAHCLHQILCKHAPAGLG